MNSGHLETRVGRFAGLKYHITEIHQLYWIVSRNLKYGIQANLEWFHSSKQMVLQEVIYFIAASGDEEFSEIDSV